MSTIDIAADASLYSGTQPVQERHLFDVARLAAWMAAHVDGFRPPLTAAQFKGGQSNPTFLLADGSGRRYVMRRKPPGQLMKSAHAVDREFRVIKALHGSDVPVARPHALCTDDSVIGTWFYVMDHVEGRIFWDQSMPGADPEERRAVYLDMVRVLAALHRVDPAAAGLADFGRPGNYFARQIGRWSSQYQETRTEEIPELDRLIVWLPGNIPAGDEDRVIHGDYRMDNMIMHPSQPRVAAVLDWELSTIGHPFGDFTQFLMGWRLPEALARGFPRSHELAALGIPEEAEIVESYCRATGRAGIENLDFYMAYNMFRMACILQGIMKRHLDGTASSPHAEELGRKARPFAEAAWAQAVRAGA